MKKATQEKKENQEIAEELYGYIDGRNGQRNRQLSARYVEGYISGTEDRLRQQGYSRL